MINFKSIPDLPEYYKAGDDGNIYSFRRSPSGLLRKPRLNKAGYQRLNFYIDGKYVTKMVHQLVCLAFHGRPKQDQVVRHLDDCKTNNKPSNLCWGSCKENSEDAKRNLKTLVGEKNHQAKLTSGEVEHIRYLRSSTKKTLQEIGDLFGIQKSQVSAIVNYRSWKE